MKYFWIKTENGVVTEFFELSSLEEGKELLKEQYEGMDEYNRQFFNLEEILNELILETWDIYGSKIVYQVKELEWEYIFIL